MQFGLARAEDNVLTPAEVAEGYTLMFDGSLASFKANFVDYVKNNPNNTNLDAKWVADATCKCITMTNPNANDIRSKKIYKDFEMRMSFRIDANQGIFYRSLLTLDKAWQTGVEYAINNVTNLGKDNPGAAYDLYAPPAPVPYFLFNTNKWNTVRIVAKGDSIEHWMNEKKVVGFKYHTPSFWATYNVSKWNTGNTLTNKVAGDRNSGYIEEGYLGLQGDHGGTWQIKDLMVTTDPCFGPLKSDGSSGCSVTGISSLASTGSQIAFSTLREASGLTVAFGKDIVMDAALVGIDGKVLNRAVLSEGGRQARFSGSYKSGLYFLRLNLASGSVTRKINIL